MSVPKGFSQRVIDAARAAIDSGKKVIYFVGTSEEDKARAGLLVLLHSAAMDQGHYLVRREILTNDLAELTFGNAFVEVLGKAGVESFQKLRTFKNAKSTIHLDSWLSTSQKNTPYELKGALVLPSDGLMTASLSKREERLHELLKRRRVQTLVLVSCTDWEDDSWLELYDPYVAILDEVDPSVHSQRISWGMPIKSKWVPRS